jgi:hypothetical protein
MGGLANTITLNVYDANGFLLEQHSAVEGLTLNQVASGLGGSGLVFGLTTGEADQLNFTLATHVGTEIFTVGATFANVGDGPETISAIALSPAVPETSTWAMMILGFLGVGFMAYRRKGGLRLV